MTMLVSNDNLEEIMAEMLEDVTMKYSDYVSEELRGRTNYYNFLSEFETDVNKLEIFDYLSELKYGEDVRDLTQFEKFIDYINNFYENNEDQDIVVFKRRIFHLTVNKYLINHRFGSYIFKYYLPMSDLLYPAIDSNLKHNTNNIQQLFIQLLLSYRRGSDICFQCGFWRETSSETYIIRI